MVGGRSADPLLLEFAAKEEFLLDKLAVIGSAYPEAGLQLLDEKNGVAWASPPRLDPVGRWLDYPLHSLPGRLHFRPPGEWEEATAQTWLATAGISIDTIAGMSCEMSGLIDEHIALTDQLLAMFNIARGTRGHWELDAQLKVILHEAVRVTGMDAGLLWMGGPEGDRTLVYPDDPDLVELVAKMAADPEITEQPDEEAVLKISGGRFPACVTGSFRAGQNRQGRLNLLSRKADRPILARDTKLAQALADLAGTFAETATLHELAVENLKTARELEIARSIQRLLIPNVMRPTASHEIAAYYQPAREVGGDFYLAEPLQHDQLLFAVGDVAGKGVPAALLMSMTRTAIMTLAGEVASPAMMVRRIAQILYSDLDQTEKMVTIVLAYYSPSTSSLAIANAGHSPVFIASERGNLVAVEPTAPPLGVSPTLEVRDQLYAFRKGDLLVAMSDGISEARNERSELFGIRRLAGLLETVKDQPAQEIVQRVVHELSEFVGKAPQADDQTIVILKGGTP